MEELERLKTRRDNLLKALESMESGAQEYSINGRSLKKVDYASLRDELKRVEWQIARYTGCDTFFAELGRL